MLGNMPTFEGPKADRIRSYMFKGGEGVWIYLPSMLELAPFISPVEGGQFGESRNITEEEYNHAKRILKLEASDCAYF